MDVSVIIINYNTLLLTKNCIDSIFEKTNAISFEVIVIDNASIDGSKEYLENDSRIIYLYNTENLGFGNANNIGIKKANGKNILFLNSDTILCNDAISKLSLFLDNHPKVGCCAGNLYDGKKNPTYSYGRLFPSILNELNFLLFYIPANLWYRKNQNHNYTQRVQHVAHVSGADMIVKRSVLNEVGIFHKDFFMYREETELCLRIANAGYEIFSVPTAQVIHLEGKSCQTNQQLRRAKWMYDSRKIFLHLHHGTFYIMVANTIHRIGITLRIFLHSFYKKESNIYWINVLKYL